MFINLETAKSVQPPKASATATNLPTAKFGRETRNQARKTAWPAKSSKPVHSRRPYATRAGGPRGRGSPRGRARDRAGTRSRRAPPTQPGPGPARFGLGFLCVAPAADRAEIRELVRSSLEVWHDVVDLSRDAFAVGSLDLAFAAIAAHDAVAQRFGHSPRPCALVALPPWHAITPLGLGPVATPWTRASLPGGVPVSRNVVAALVAKREKSHTMVGAGLHSSFERQLTTFGGAS